MTMRRVVDGEWEPTVPALMQLVAASGAARDALPRNRFGKAVAEDPRAGTIGRTARDLADVARSGIQPVTGYRVDMEERFALINRRLALLEEQVRRLSEAAGVPCPSF